MNLSRLAKFTATFLLSLCLFSITDQAWGQRARFDDLFPLQNTVPTLPSLPTPPPRILSFPQTNPTVTPNLGGLLPQSNPTFGGAIPGTGGTGFSGPGFDPFSTGNRSFPVFPRVQTPQFQPQGLALPNNLQPRNFPQFGQPNFQGPAFQGPFQQSPLFNGFTGIQGPDFSPAVDFASNTWNSFRDDFLPRVFERPRIRNTWIQGTAGDAGLGNELDINDTEFSSVINIPRFFGGPQPLRITPAFIAHFWNGPETAVTGVDLPEQAFSALLGFDHTTNPARAFGLETNATVGVYSDYDNFSSDSLRLTGRLVGWRRFNEYFVGKLGVEYFDRIRTKLLPVVGFYAKPTPDFRLDITFPRSKIAHRIPNINNFEAWVYGRAEYGGGSWAIERTSGEDDQVDINDVRAIIGMEWISPRRITGYFEAGYVFERELVFQSSTIDNIQIEDSFLLSLGVAF